MLSFLFGIFSLFYYGNGNNRYSSQFESLNMIPNNRGTGDYDEIQDIYGYTYTSIESIVDIPGFVNGVDYELSGDKVHWIGSKPTSGTDYNITFR